MTNLEHSEADPSGATRLIKICLGAALYALSLFTMIWMENNTKSGFSIVVESVLVLTSAVVLITITFLWTKSLELFEAEEPVAPSTKKSHRILILSGLFGAVWSVIFYLSVTGSGTNLGDISLFSNSAVPPLIAILSAVTFVVVMIYACYKWQQTSDEHERAAINYALRASFYFYAIATPTWWMLQRSLLVPAQDPMIMYTLVLIIFSAAWTYKRGE